MIASNDVLSNPANFMPPIRASLFYAARCTAVGGSCLRREKCRIFCQSAFATNAFSPRNFKPN